jgi:hypothetical protein
LSASSKAKRDKKKMVERKKYLAAAAMRINFDNPNAVQRGLNKLFSPTSLTTPREINDDILAFCATINDVAPIYITAQPEPWSRQACCERNVKEYISLHGGEIVCGYRIWFNAPSYIEAERHAIWHSAGVYRDVSFSPDGEQRSLFMPDRSDRQGSLDDNLLRIRWGKDYDTKRLIELQEQMESSLNIGRMSDEQSWNTMPSFAEWQDGKRMSSMVETTPFGTKL